MRRIVLAALLAAVAAPAWAAVDDAITLMRTAGGRDRRLLDEECL